MARIFIYGSCVTRDAFDVDADDFELVRYVARQGIISAMAAHKGPLVDSSALTSNFQRGMVDGDSAGNLCTALEENIEFVDAILWDLTDERMGVLAFSDDRYLTPLNELRATDDDILNNGESVLFGTDRHFALFTAAVKNFADWLRSRGILEKVTVIATPHSSVVDEELSGIDLADIAERASGWNRQVRRYYDQLEAHGFRIEYIENADVAIDPQHRWGVAPFHFAQRTYSAIRALVRRVVMGNVESDVPCVDSVLDFEVRLRGLWPNGMDVTRAGQNWCITLPNGQNVEIPEASEGVDWNMKFSTDHATSSMWLRSMIYLPWLDRLGARGLVERMVSSYANFIERMLRDEEFYRTNSLDHLVSLALYSLSRLRVQRAEDGNAVSGHLLDEWLQLVIVLERLARSPKVYRDNNHGMFLNVSLLLCHVVWPEARRVEGIVSNDVRRMMRLLNRSFTTEGVTVENTPHYQAIWIRLIDQARYLLSFLHQMEVQPALETLYRQTSDAFRIMLLPDGSVPPFGDGRRAMPADTEGRDGTLYSPDAGLYLRKSGRNYFSFKCGYASNVHKHLDDTSMFLMVEGVELLADLGLSNYDSFDMKSSLWRGQQGHSMIAFPDLDYLAQSFVYPADYQSVASWSMERLQLEGAVRVSAGGSIIPGYQVERSVTMRSYRNILVRDSARSTFVGTAVQRFIVPAGAVCSVSHGDVIVVNEGLSMRLRFDTAVDECTVKFRHSRVSNHQVVERAILADGSVYTVSIVVSDVGGRGAA